MKTVVTVTYVVEVDFKNVDSQSDLDAALKHQIYNDDVVSVTTVINN